MQQDKSLEKRVQERISISKDDIVDLDIVLEDDISISHVGIKERDVIIYGCKTKIGCIGGVATRPEYRKKGLATRLMQIAAQKINDDGGDIMFVSGNRDLYRRQGCVPAAPHYQFKIGQADMGRLDDSDIELVPYKKDNLLDIANTHQREPVRFRRDLDEFQVLLERRTPAPFWTKTAVLALYDDGRFMGYLLTQEPRDAERGKGRIRGIAEYAGARKTIADSMKPLFARYNMEELMFFVQEHDSELLHILRQRGIEGEKANMQGHTFKILNLPRLMDRFAPYIQERVGKDTANSLKCAQDGDEFRITYKQECLELDGEALVALIFGTYDEAEKEIMSRLEGMTDVLQALFPLPFLWPGLNSY
ncbi:GNAT family N-acetyltransferase [Candidatus Poribacteria bacterium]